MKLLKVKVLCLLLFLVGCCRKTADEYPGRKNFTRNETDDSFLIQAMRYDLAASDMAQTILFTSTDTSVRELAQTVVRNTEIDKNQLNKLAFGAVALPEKCDEDHIAAKDVIAKMNGKSLDSAYIRYQLTIYSKTIDLLNNERLHGQYVPITDYAKAHLPIVLSEQRNADSILHGL